MLLALVLCGVATAGYLAWFGRSYYSLPLPERPYHPMHARLRPSGEIGIRLGLLSALVFAGIYLYPLRKRWRWLQKFGATRRWLDVHVVLGLVVPLLVTVHASFKLHGLVGMAYWIMMAIVVSGVAGRYLYAQIPRSVTAAELSRAELTERGDRLTEELRRQHVFTEEELARVMALPGGQEVAAMPLWRVLLAMISADLRRPFRVAALRRKVIAPGERLWTLGGLLPSRHAELETVLSCVSASAWLTAKILFLKRAAEIFHLWHVVHKPFSYSFAVIVAAHIALVTLMGYL
jgi:hypothetical protein